MISIQGKFKLAKDIRVRESIYFLSTLIGK